MRWLHLAQRLPRRWPVMLTIARARQVTVEGWQGPKSRKESNT